MKRMSLMGGSLPSGTIVRLCAAWEDTLPQRADTGPDTDGYRAVAAGAGRVAALALPGRAAVRRHAAREFHRSGPGRRLAALVSRLLRAEPRPVAGHLHRGPAAARP